MLIPVLMAQDVLWAWQRPYLFMAIGLQIVGLIGFSLFIVGDGYLALLGCAAGDLVCWRGQKRPLSEPQFTTKGPYALVRHPLYFFFIAGALV